MAVYTVSESEKWQKFLDENQYTVDSILRYEKMFGEGFVSTGGLETTQEFVKYLDLKENQYVLDLGCGIGGSPFYMARTYKANVLGIDLSTNMVNIAMDRVKKCPELKDRVELKLMDAMTANFEPNTFDVIYSRDTILHIEKKQELFALCLKWLKPGGQLMITDYCCGTSDGDEEFQKYVKQRNYFLLDPASYGKIIEKVGFTNVEVQDRTDQFVEILKKEIAKTEQNKQDVLKILSQVHYDSIINGWKQKVKRCGSGYQKWGFFRAKKAI